MGSSGSKFYIRENTALTQLLALKVPIKTAADDKFCGILPNFQKKKVPYFMRIVCQQIVMKYHAFFVIVVKVAKFYEYNIL